MSEVTEQAPVQVPQYDSFVCLSNVLNRLVVGAVDALFSLTYTTRILVPTVLTVPQ